MIRKDEPLNTGRETEDVKRAVCSSEDLIAYLYEEDTAAERRSFELHLAGCEACRDELSQLRSVREDLRAWQVEPAPRLDLVLKRRPLEVLRELVGLFPVWVRAVSATAVAAAALVAAFAIAGTSIDLREGRVSFGLRTAQSGTGIVAREAGAAGSADRAPMLTRAEIESMIEARVVEARAEEEARFAARERRMEARLARLTAELAAANRSQAQMRDTIATLRAEQRAMLARGQATLGEWLFAVNGSRESWGTDDEREE